MTRRNGFHAGRNALDSSAVRGSEPVRTCVGCRSRAAKSDLLRVAVVGGALTFDLRGRLPGRGAHLHPDPRCLDLAERRRAFARALRLPGPVDVTPLREQLAARGDAPASPRTPEHRSGRSG